MSTTALPCLLRMGPGYLLSYRRQQYTHRRICQRRLQEKLRDILKLLIINKLQRKLATSGIGLVKLYLFDFKLLTSINVKSQHPPIPGCQCIYSCNSVVLLIFKTVGDYNLILEFRIGFVSGFRFLERCRFSKLALLLSCSARALRLHFLRPPPMLT